MNVRNLKAPRKQMKRNLKAISEKKIAGSPNKKVYVRSAVI